MWLPTRPSLLLLCFFCLLDAVLSAPLFLFRHGGEEVENQETTREAPTPPPRVDALVDLNGDGSLSLQEVQYAAFVHHGLSGSVVEQLFRQVDDNKDGVLTAAEFDNIRPLVLAKAENAALRYLQSVDTDGDGLLSLPEAQAYMLREYGIGARDVERVWKLVVPATDALMGPTLFSKLRRRIRGMTIRLARQIMKAADLNGDGHISLGEAQAIAFEQEGIGAEDVAAMMASVDDNEDGELNAPEFADFERIVRARAVETSKRALKVVDADGSGTLTLDEAKRIAFEHYGFDEAVLGSFFAQADESEDGQLDAIEFAGFRSVIRSRAVKNALDVMAEVDADGDGLVSIAEAEEKTRREDDMETAETRALFHIADQNKSGKLDRVELADFVRLARLSAIKFATDHFVEFDANQDGRVSEDELSSLITQKYDVPPREANLIFRKVDVDASGELIPAEIVDYRHAIREYVRSHHPIVLERHTEIPTRTVPAWSTSERTTSATTTTSEPTTTFSTSGPHPSPTENTTPLVEPLPIDDNNTTPISSSSPSSSPIPTDPSSSSVPPSISPPQSTSAPSTTTTPTTTTTTVTTTAIRVTTVADESTHVTTVTDQNTTPLSSSVPIASPSAPSSTPKIITSSLIDEIEQAAGVIGKASSLDKLPTADEQDDESLEAALRREQASSDAAAAVSSMQITLSAPKITVESPASTVTVAEKEETTVAERSSISTESSTTTTTLPPFTTTTSSTPFIPMTRTASGLLVDEVTDADADYHAAVVAAAAATKFRDAASDAVGQEDYISDEPSLDAAPGADALLDVAREIETDMEEEKEQARIIELRRRKQMERGTTMEQGEDATMDSFTTDVSGFSI